MGKYDDRVSLFSNLNKDSDKHPDFKGSFTVSEEVAQHLLDGGKVYVAMWEREDKNGDLMYSGNIQVPQKKDEGGGRKRKGTPDKTRKPTRSSRDEESEDDENPF